MKNLIKKILKESGFLDSTEEDWEWANDEIWDGKIHKGQNYHYVMPPKPGIKGIISNDEWIGIQNLIISLGVSVAETRSSGEDDPRYNGYEDVEMGAVVYIDDKGTFHTENFMPYDRGGDWKDYVEEGSIEIPLEHLLLLSKKNK